ncbi:hypothetical protein A2U01_0068747, partial [Trifolium medium]|nr:hypothetical protein [Trifolium medium]
GIIDAVLERFGLPSRVFGVGFRTQTRRGAVVWLSSPGVGAPLSRVFLIWHGQIMSASILPFYYFKIHART